jgi:hypothetical protein
MKSTVGRPRALTDRQVREVLAEHARFLAWKALRSTVKSPRELACELRVSPATIRLAIRSKGQYKQVSPDQRAQELVARHLKLSAGRTKRSL